jgi:hypothetical protein
MRVAYCATLFSISTASRRVDRADTVLASPEAPRLQERTFKTAVTSARIDAAASVVVDLVGRAVKISESIWGRGTDANLYIGKA